MSPVRNTNSEPGFTCGKSRLKFLFMQTLVNKALQCLLGNQKIVREEIGKKKNFGKQLIAKQCVGYATSFPVSAESWSVIFVFFACQLVALRQTIIRKL